MKKITVLLPVVIAILACSTSGPEKPAVDPARPHIAVRLAFNPESYSRFFAKTIYPQIAVWIRDGSGSVKTVFVTEKGARDKWFGASTRPDAMPVWYAAARDEKKAVMESGIDAVTGATPSGETCEILWQAPEGFRGKAVELYIEANISFDYNDFYKKGLPENDPAFNGVNGQPSVVWLSRITLGGGEKEYTPKIAGHGHPMGKDGKVYADMSKITTARTLFSYISVKYFPGNKR
ncbi:MAG: hypothetical protein MUD12_15725 [Spirochaetes bacterium]|jgi:hypothetical protein|nr:hypothetical protein [Spirochaetota bacterium]